MSIKDSLNSLIDDRIEFNRLNPDSEKNEIGETSGSADIESDGTGGIDWPLTETGREVYADTVIQSSDGFFTLVLNPVKSLTLKDGSGSSGKMNLKSS